MKDINWDRYSDVPDDVVNELMWSADKCYEFSVSARNRIKGNCQTLLIFIASGVAGIAGVVMSGEMRDDIVPLILFGISLVLQSLYILWHVWSAEDLIPYQRPKDRYHKGVDGSLTGKTIQRMQLEAYNVSTEDIKKKLNASSTAFNVSVVWLLLSSVIFVLAKASVYFPCVV